MLRCAQQRTIFRCVHVFIRERSLWLDACFQSFVSPFTSKANAITATPVNPSASKVSRNHGNSESNKVGGDAKISVPNAGRKDVDATALSCSHQDANSHPVDGDASIFEFAPCIPYATGHVTNGDVRGSESMTSPNDDIILTPSSKFNRRCWPSNASCGKQSLNVSLQGQKASSDLQQKIELVESEQFSLSDATVLVKTRAFKSCSVEQLATVLQVLKKSFPCAKVVHDTLVRSSNVLLQPAELVQQKLKILYNFQVNEKVVSKLCGRGRVLLVSMESLKERLMFFKDIGLTVEARNKMFARGPLILSFPIENTIKPALEFLESTGLTKEIVLKLAQRCPEIFYISLDSNLIKKYEYFRQLGLSANKFPRVFLVARRFSIKSIEEHRQFLYALGFTDDDVRLMLEKQPAILALSSENLKCKMDFLICEQKRDLAEIAHVPSCLTYSLQARMVPRFNVVKESGNSKVFSLSSILCPTDSTFMKRFGK